MTASITSQLTSWVGHHGAYAIFVLMAIDAVFPAGSELVMLFAGALASGGIASQHPTLFGAQLHVGIESYVVLALAGTLGYLAGALAGWAIGRRGGRPLIERHGRRLHLSPENFDKAERWFDRFGGRAVFLGRLTPVIRSFISIPAGVLRSPLPSYTILTLAGSAIWCFALAGVGWALGGSYEDFHHAFRYADYAAVAAAVVAAGVVLYRWRRSRIRARTAGEA
jgi:membrane protein DedA with SNARE-associated domain